MAAHENSSEKEQKPASQLPIKILLVVIFGGVIAVVLRAVGVF